MAGTHMFRRSHSKNKPLMRLLSDCSGAALVEMALALPIVLLLLLGTIDVSFFVAQKLDLEQAAQRTTDFALSSRPRSNDATYLVEEAAKASGLPHDNIKVLIYLECNGEKQSDFNEGCPGGQQRARYVNVTISKVFEPVVNWQAFANAMGFGGEPGPMTVVGDSVVRFQ